MKIVFFGTPDFAVESLKAIVEAGFDVAAVVTATDKPAGRGHKLQCSAVKTYALEKGIEVLQPEKLKDDSFLTRLREIGADLFVVIAFRMLPQQVWALPPKGTFNLHASLLPRYRGAAPINHAVMNGDTKTGVTTFFLSHEIDTGDIIDRVEVDILPDENVGDVHDKLMKVGAELTIKTIRDIDNNTLISTPQEKFINEGEKCSPAPKIFKETGHVDWRKSDTEIHNLVRGLSPYPGAWSVLSDGGNSTSEIKILRTSLSDIPSDKMPGVIEYNAKKMFVNTSTNKIEILELQVSGKKRMAAESYLKGARLNDAKFINPSSES